VRLFGITRYSILTLLNYRHYSILTLLNVQVDLRLRLFGDWNPRTKKAQQMLKALRFT
jgi:hypothetical protein